MNLRAMPGGEWELETTGSDPYVFTETIAANWDAREHHILSFEYFSLTGTEDTKVYLGPPITEASTVTGPGLHVSEGWSSYSLDLAAGLAQAKGKVSLLRLDFGSRAKKSLRIRNLQLRAPTASELEFEKRLAEQRQKETDAGQSLSRYLAVKYVSHITKVRAGANQIVIEGKLDSAGENLVLLELPIYSDNTDSGQWRVISKLRPSRSGGFRVEVQRDAGSRDRLFSRWAVAKLSPQGIELISHARYADEVQPVTTVPEEKPRTRKGLGAFWYNRPVSDIDDLGIGGVTINVRLNQFMRMQSGPGRTAFVYANRTWFVEDGVIAEFDKTMIAAAKKHLVVSAIILLSQVRDAEDKEYARLIAHPDAHPAGIFVMPNVNDAAGHAAYAAAMNYLAQRYSRPDGKYGRIHHWIMHNEVDAGWEWTNAGEKTSLRYLELYQKSLRTAHLIARQYDPHAQAFISLTHYWTEQASPHFYPSRTLLEHLLAFSQAEGDFEWAIAYHPYPQDLRNPRTWEDVKATFSFDTPQITFKNLEVLDAWVKLPQTKFLGVRQRKVHLTEQGPNSPDYSPKSLSEQAASMAYAWKKLERLPSIEIFHYHNWIDNRGEGGLRIGLRRFPDDKDDPQGAKPVWKIFQAADTANEDASFEASMKVIGIQDWKDIQYRGPIQ